MKFYTIKVSCIIYGVYIYICNMGTCCLPDIYTLRLQVYISGKSLLPMLQLINIT